MEWFKRYWERILLTTLAVTFVGITIYNQIQIRKLKYSVGEIYKGIDFIYHNSVPKSVGLDFTNKTGCTRIQAGFTDLLINSEGSIKKGEGYEVHLKTTNPSSLYLSSNTVIYSWVHNGQSQAATVTNPNAILYPASGITESAFLSPVEGDELKSIFVSVTYDLMKSLK
jgi:hypothetical protein